MSPGEAVAAALQRQYDEERAFQIERRRLLIAEVGT